MRFAKPSSFSLISPVPIPLLPVFYGSLVTPRVPPRKRAWALNSQNKKRICSPPRLLQTQAAGCEISVIWMLLSRNSAPRFRPFRITHPRTSNWPLHFVNWGKKRKPRWNSKELPHSTPSSQRRRNRKLHLVCSAIILSSKCAKPPVKTPPALLAPLSPQLPVRMVSVRSSVCHSFSLIIHSDNFPASQIPPLLVFRSSSCPPESFPNVPD